jgi:hypothetical protein
MARDKRIARRRGAVTVEAFLISQRLEAAKRRWRHENQQDDPAALPPITNGTRHTLSHPTLEQYDRK